MPQGLVDVLPCFGAISPQLFMDIARKLGRYNEAVFLAVDLSELDCRGSAGVGDNDLQITRAAIHASNINLGENRQVFGGAR